MAGALFLDTAGWFAALSPREQGHETARDTYADAVRRGQLLVTTPWVAAEMHTLILRWRGPRAGTFFLVSVFDTGAHVVVSLDVELFAAALSHCIRRSAVMILLLADTQRLVFISREHITGPL